MSPTSWTAPEPVPVDGPTVGPEGPLLAGYLRWQRHTLLSICGGLSAEQLVTRAVPSSTLTLLGLVRHLAFVERIWFVERFAGEDLPPLYPGGIQGAFTEVDAANAQADFERYVEVTEHAATVAAGLDLDATWVDRDGDALSLRFVHYHVIHEYSRHNGHADLLREAIDGVRGR